MTIFYAWLLYPFTTLTYWWYWLILLIVLAYWFFSYHDCPAHFDMYVHTVVYLVVLVIDSFACIVSWSYLSMLFLSLFILIVIACMWTWVIYMYPAWLYVTWPLFFCMIACRLSVWAAHLSSYFQSSSFRSFLSFWLSLLQVWGLVCACFSDLARG